MSGCDLQVINSILDGKAVLGGDDLPALALFLVTHANCEHIVTQVPCNSVLHSPAVPVQLWDVPTVCCRLEQSQFRQTQQPHQGLCVDCVADCVRIVSQVVLAKLFSIDSQVEQTSSPCTEGLTFAALLLWSFEW